MAEAATLNLIRGNRLGAKEVVPYLVKTPIFANTNVSPHSLRTISFHTSFHQSPPFYRQVHI